MGSHQESNILVRCTEHEFVTDVSLHFHSSDLQAIQSLSNAITSHCGICFAVGKLIIFLLPNIITEKMIFPLKERTSQEDTLHVSAHYPPFKVMVGITLQL